jgi:hypothetical protein
MLQGDWQVEAILPGVTGAEVPLNYAEANQAGAEASITFNGRQAELVYRTGPQQGIWDVSLDGEPYLDEDGQPLRIDAYSENVRYEVTQAFVADETGEHTLTIVNSGESRAESGGTGFVLARVEVLPLYPESNLPLVIGLLVALELVGLVLAVLLGPALAGQASEAFDTKRSIFLALVAYGIIAVWGFLLNAVIEFWFLAWMVAVVQGGSQALSRSLFASLSPASKSGEFFGLFSIMEKFASFIGPLFFAAAVALFDSSRPGVLSLVIFFVVGGLLLTRVNVEEGRAVARAEDAAALDAG